MENILKTNSSSITKPPCPDLWSGGFNMLESISFCPFS